MNADSRILSIAKHEILYFYIGWVSFIEILSQLYIPLWPVPITGQTFAFLMLGLLTTPRQSLQISASYVLLGIAGLPFFHGFLGGIGILTSPTFGYILGYPLIAVLISGFKPYIRGFYSFVLFSLVAVIPCFVLGILYLSPVLGFNTILLYSGFLIFIPGEFLKIILAYSIYSKKN